MSYNLGAPYIVEFLNERVEADIRNWPEGIYACFVRLTEKVEHNGPRLQMPHSRPFGGGLFELRAHGPEGIGRAFFCTLVGRRIVILHGFVKKTQETPAHEIRLARKRQKQIQNR